MGVKKEDVEEFDIIFHEIKKLKEIFRYFLNFR